MKRTRRFRQSVVLRFGVLYVVGQQRHIEVADILQFQLSQVSLVLAEEHGCLRKGNKAMLVKSLGNFCH